MLRHIARPMVITAIPFLSAMPCSAVKSVPKPVKDAVLTIADDTCKEVAGDAGLDPSLVTLLCDDGTQLVKVIMPRAAFYAAKRANIDAGPGI